METNMDKRTSNIHLLPSTGLVMAAPCLKQLVFNTLNVRSNFSVKI